MPNDLGPALLAIVGLSLLACFLNGYGDCGSVVATIISSGTLRARTALLLAAAAELVGPFAFGAAVASAVGKGLVEPTAMTDGALIAALLSTCFWGVGASYLGLPTSMSHALVGSLVGAALLVAGPGAVQAGGVAWTVLALLVSPILGFGLAYSLLKLTLRLATGASPHLNSHLRRAQVIASLALGVSHGTNQAQKWMGTIALGFVVDGRAGAFEVPFWVIAASAVCFSLGTAAGGWRVLRTLGMRLYRIRPVHGFASQTASALIILGAAIVGGPVSTTHVAGSAIMGSGAADRLSMVRWGVAGGIFAAWLITLPGAVATAAALLFALRLAGLAG